MGPSPEGQIERLLEQPKLEVAGSAPRLAEDVARLRLERGRGVQLDLRLGVARAAYDGGRQLDPRVGALESGADAIAGQVLGERRNGDRAGDESQQHGQNGSAKSHDDPRGAARMPERPFRSGAATNYTAWD